MHSQDDGVPQNVFERDKTVASWDNDYYHAISVRHYDRAVTDVLRLLGVGPDDAVLDAGCGPGVHSIRAARYGARVRAIDLSETMLTHARARAAAAGLGHRIVFSQDDLTNLSIAAGEFKYVFSWGVLIHVPEAAKAIGNLARVVQPRGRLALHVLNEGSLDFRLERIARALLGKPLRGLEETALGTGNWYSYNDDRLWVQRFNTRALVEAMRSHGLRLVAKRGAEFSEVHRRIPKILRPLLLLANNIAYLLRLPVNWYCTHILVFEKTASPAAS